MAAASGRTVSHILADQHDAFMITGLDPDSRQQRIGGTGEVPIEEATDVDELDDYEDWNSAQTAAWAKKQGADLHGAIVRHKLQGRHLERVTAEILTQRFLAAVVAALLVAGVRRDEGGGGRRTGGRCTLLIRRRWGVPPDQADAFVDAVERLKMVRLERA